MYHPYQRLQIYSKGTSRFLLISSGPKLFSVNLDDGNIVSTWPEKQVKSQNENSEGDEITESPTKRRKLAVAQEYPPDIINIQVTKSQNHAVIVTGEDKTIHVLEIAADGNLQQLSERSMPKRPCAIVISPDDASVMSGDKFGDVYSLPLLPTPDQLEAPASSLTSKEMKTFAPAATKTTVHSKANRRILESQLKQAQENKHQTKVKDPLTFAHELVLGHVSLLTDLLVVTVEGINGSAKPRTYVLTSDRDEHIRISRGPPQSFVIEGFCLGHVNFVNKMCLVEPELLVSGGGDDELYVWHWLEYKLVGKVNLLEAVKRERSFLKQLGSKVEALDENVVTVTGLWTCSDRELGKAELLIACEGIPALFHLSVSSLRDIKEHIIGAIPLSGNVLDVAVSEGGIVISVDNIHEVGSITSISQSQDFKIRLLAFDLIGRDEDSRGLWRASEHLNYTLVNINQQSTVEWNEKKLQALLYGAENLRKRNHGDDVAAVLYEGFLALGIAAGGQLTTTDDVENYPGFKEIKGTTLMDNMREQSEACGTEIITQTLAKVDLSCRPFKYWLHPMGEDDVIEEETHTADALIIATGAKARRLDLIGEEKYWGNGVSACAVCDGSLPIFRQKPLVVIGGGDSAVEEAIYLTKKASKVYVLVRRNVLRASRANARRLTTNPKVEIRYETGATEIIGEEKERGLMTGLKIKNLKTGKEETLEANGLFYAVGHEPATELFKDQLKMDEDGYLITEPGRGLTSVEGVFAAGDVQDKKYRQAITSAGSGCVAALEAEKWLGEQESGGEESTLENSTAEKSQTNSSVPEYRANPLL